MYTAVAQPHDGLFRKIFADPQHVVRLLQANLPPAFVARLNWDTLARKNGSFVKKGLEQVHSDLIFSIREHNGEELFLYFLIEHQSTPDPHMPLRLLSSLAAFWTEFAAAHSQQHLPVIIPIVGSHATSGWTSATQLRELFDASQLASIEANFALKLVPEFSFLVDDLTLLSDDQLHRRANTAAAALALWLLRDARQTDRFLQGLPVWAAIFARLGPEPGARAILKEFLFYISHVVKDVQLHQVYDIIAEHSDDSKETIMTIAEQLRLEGEARGARNMLRRLLAKRFGALPAWVDQRLQAANEQDLESWTDSVLDAATLEQAVGSHH